MKLYALRATHEILVHPVSNFSINGTEYGLPYPSLYGKLKYLKLDSSDLSPGDLTKIMRNRSILILKAQEIFTSKPHWDVFSAMIKSPKHTLLLVVPKNKDVLQGPKKCDDAHATTFAQAELPKCEDSKVYQESLIKLEELFKVAKCPIGIIQDGDEIEEVCKLASANGGLLSDEIRLITRQFEPSSVSKFSSFNLFGSLKNQTLDDSAPTLLITAPLDTFNFVQTISSTAGYNTPLVALLELVKIFGQGLPIKGPLPWKVKFLLTTGTVVDFYGLKYFLKKEKVDFAIALDDLSGDSLYVHGGFVDDKTQGFVKALKSVLGAEFKERDSSGTEFYFAHDVFTKHKIPAVTITSVERGVLLPLRLSSFHFRFNPNVLSDKISKIAESLVKFFNGKSKKVDVKPESLLSWDTLLSEPRNTFEADISGLKSVALVVEHLEEYLNLEKETFKTSVSTSVIKSPSVNKATVYASKHAIFDIFIATAVFSYIFLVWSVVRTPKNAIKEIGGILSVFVNPKSHKE
ncbi:hypothetical protein BEWA_028180 [Theileria equi strain WA]|uniref:Uncharacterized protein n=1 Tax=Theileria equi strain WA TaxID=1537102 RepID=L0AYL3_THEEQ|nr:hypothetical protein BEWA_028180 [Theileria equi strain WA]AFZ79969.1 hypothetical protein BEWA_028180 [Theileria equi strain WA]|eukprot:XP_004829635.1 hypothetical protein BEWA_028180 [Theileria equi strain WA]